MSKLQELNSILTSIELKLANRQLDRFDEAASGTKVNIEMKDGKIHRGVMIHGSGGISRSTPGRLNVLIRRASQGKDSDELYVDNKGRVKVYVNGSHEMIDIKKIKSVS